MHFFQVRAIFSKFLISKVWSICFNCIVCFWHFSKTLHVLKSNQTKKVILVLPGNIESLIVFFSFTAWLFYGATMLALILLRYKTPYNEKFRPYKVSGEDQWWNFDYKNIYFSLFVNLSLIKISWFYSHLGTSFIADNCLHYLDLFGHRTDRTESTDRISIRNIVHCFRFAILCAIR